jgi:rhamnosyltransferase
MRTLVACNDKVNKLQTKIALIILTRNAMPAIERQIAALQSQSLRSEMLLFVDTVSTDGTQDFIKKHEFNFYSLKQTEFDHGAARQLAVNLVDADIYIFMTQDAIPADDDAIKNLVAIFATDAKVGCVYGRQLPRQNAAFLEAHARLFNYKAESLIFSYEDRKKYGIKVCFNSDSFAAYRKIALAEIGGFPKKIIFGEDMYVAAKMLMHGWRVAYSAESKVYHSHNYSFLQEFRRYFDIGVFHQDNLWILENFGTARAEGLKYVRSEIKYCITNRAYLSLFEALGNSFAKFLGYKLGRNYKFLAPRLRKKFSRSPAYWGTVK